MVSDGDQVSFVGHFGAPAGVRPGDQGVVLSAMAGGGDGGGYVQWRTGERAGQVDLMVAGDLRVQAHGPDPLDDSLEVGPRLAVRDVYEEQGEAGLLAALDEAGVLSGLAQIAEDVVALASARVRTDLAPVLAQLDPDEVDAVVGLATTACMREALGA